MEKQFEFLLINYTKNFLEQEIIDFAGLSTDEIINMIYSDAELSPKFSNFLLFQMSQILFKNGEAEFVKEQYLAANN